MKKTLLALFLFTIPINSSAQEYFFKEINAFKFSPLRMVDPITPGLEFSFEKQLLPIASVQLTGAKLMIMFPALSNPITNLEGTRWALEVKYFLAQAKKSVWYASFEAAFVQSEYNTILNFSYYDDSIHVKKKTTSLNFKTGFYFDFKPIVLDFYAGIGLKFRNVRHEERLNPRDNLYNEILPYNPHYFASQETRKLKFNVPLGFRVGYNF
ncbi:MAG: hypothetical protein IPJ79_04065 [Bacteroidetes bacterium]|nr:hypothetical protein [Bacteroidota bacterium]HNR19158.1 hypothetical protein [Bacteroidia bacterium]HNU32586.1 hypothetical protein [Bacteroidia bacterium]